MDTSTRDTYLAGAGAHVAGKALDVAFGFASVWLLTRILGAADYGVLLVGLTVVTLAELVATGGFERIVLLRVSRLDPSAGRHEAAGIAGAALRWAFATSVALAVVLRISAGSLAGLFDEPALYAWLALLAWRLPAHAARAVHAAWLRAAQRPAAAVLAGATLPTAATAALLAVAWIAELGRTGVAVAWIGGVLIAAIACQLLRPARVVRPRAGLAASDLAYGAKLMLAGVVQKGVWTTDVLVLGALATSTVTAQYGVAAKLALLALFGHQVLGAIFTPRIGRLLASGEHTALRAEYAAVRTVSVVVALLFAALACAFGRPVLACFGSEFDDAFGVLLVLAGAYLIPASFGANGAYLNMTGRGAWSLASSLLLLVCNVALNVTLIPRFGALGAATATLISLAAVNALVSAVIWRLDRFPTWSLQTAAVVAATLTVLAGTVTGAVHPQVTALLTACLVAWIAVRGWQRGTTAAALASLRTPSRLRA